jgi:hypothetical protein
MRGSRDFTISRARLLLLMQMFSRAAVVALMAASVGYSATLFVSNVIPNMGEGTINGGTLWLSENGVDTNLPWAGAFSVKLNGTTTYTVYCLDAFTDISLNKSYTAALGAPVTAVAQRAAWLLNKEFESATTPALGAALQIAIWTIIHDTPGITVLPAHNTADTTDKIQMASSAHPTPAAIVTQVDAYLLESVNKVSFAPTVFTNCSGTNCATPAQTLIAASVPEPSSCLLMICGGGVLLWKKRKQLRQGKRVKL